MDAAAEYSLPQLLERIAALEVRVRDLEAENRRLREQLDDAQRAAARQAAPFRRRESTKVPDGQKKRPGRPKGHKGAYRVLPEQVDETVEVPLPECPQCGGAVTARTPAEQFIEEIPVMRPSVTRLITYQGWCQTCGDVSSTHPLQTSTAVGAAKVQLGPRARALAVELRQRCGLTMRNTCRVLERLTGLKLSPGGLALAVQRTALRVRPCFDRLVDDVRGSAAVFVDETSWYVGTPGFWLWTFTTADSTVYHVDSSRGRQVVLEMMGPSFDGVLVSDCLASYENLPYRTHKCIAHHQKAIAEARARPDTKDASHLNQWKLLFTMATALWRHREGLGKEQFAQQKRHLGDWLDRLLGESRTQSGDVAIQNRIRKRRDVVLGCLDDPAAEPTNNRAERSLRPAVIARKLSCGNRTERGKEAWQMLTSLTATCDQRRHDFAAWLAARLPLAAPLTGIPTAR
jgi:transposase